MLQNEATLKLVQGINIIFGKNNVGKTVLLEAISSQFSHKPFYCLETIHWKRLLETRFKELCTTPPNKNFKEKIHSKMLNRMDIGKFTK